MFFLVPLKIYALKKFVAYILRKLLNKYAIYSIIVILVLERLYNGKI